MKNVILQSVANCKLALGDKFAVGCSGGVDSISLCFALKMAGLTNFIAIICNHNIRQNAGAEAVEVQNYLQQNGIEAVVLHLKDFEKTRNLENNARKARQNAMFGYCLQNNISNLLLAHHKNDSAETFFMRLERGTGLAGLCGIEKQNTFCCLSGNKIYNINILRPFIEINKHQIIDFASKNKLKTWQDETNNDTKIRRNFVRNFLEHAFKEQKTPSQSIHNIAITIANLQSENAFINNQFKQYFTACVKEFEKFDANLFPNAMCSEINIKAEEFFKAPYNIRRLILGQIISVLNFCSKSADGNIAIFAKNTIRESKLQNLDDFLSTKNTKTIYKLQGVCIKHNANICFTVADEGGTE